MSTQVTSRKNNPLSLENRQKLRPNSNPRPSESRARSRSSDTEGSAVNPFAVIAVLVVLGVGYLFVNASRQQGAVSLEAEARNAELLDAQYLAADQARLAAEAGSLGLAEGSLALTDQ